MKTILSLVRIAALTLLCAAAILLIFGEEYEVTATVWCLHKLLGIAAGAAAGLLYKRWCITDPWLRAYDNMCDHVIDRPNPTRR